MGHSTSAAPVRSAWSRGQDDMIDRGLLAGRDIGAAGGALVDLVDRAVAPFGRTAAEYLALRQIAGCEPFDSAADLIRRLTGQRQIGLDPADIGAMLDRLWTEGLLTPGPIELTTAGRSALVEMAAAVAPVTRKLFADIDRAELAAADRVLVRLIARAQALATATA